MDLFEIFPFHSFPLKGGTALFDPFCLIYLTNRCSAVPVISAEISTCAAVSTHGRSGNFAVAFQRAVDRVVRLLRQFPILVSGLHAIDNRLLQFADRDLRQLDQFLLRRFTVSSCVALPSFAVSHAPNTLISAINAAVMFTAFSIRMLVRCVYAPPVFAARRQYEHQ